MKSIIIALIFNLFVLLHLPAAILEYGTIDPRSINTIFVYDVNNTGNEFLGVGGTGQAIATVKVDDQDLTLQYDRFDVRSVGSFTNSASFDVTVGLGQVEEFIISVTVTDLEASLPKSGFQTLSPGAGGIFEINETVVFQTITISGDYSIQGPVTTVEGSFQTTQSFISGFDELAYDLDSNGFPGSISLVGGRTVISNGSTFSTPIFSGTVDGANIELVDGSVGISSANMTMGQVPEPTSAALLLGVVGLLFARRRRA